MSTFTTPEQIIIPVITTQEQQTQEQQTQDNTHPQFCICNSSDIKWVHKAIFIFGVVTWGVGILEINYNLGFGIFLLCFGGLIVLFEIMCGYGLLKHLNM